MFPQNQGRTRGVLCRAVELLQKGWALAIRTTLGPRCPSTSPFLCQASYGNPSTLFCKKGRKRSSGRRRRKEGAEGEKKEEKAGRRQTKSILEKNTPK